MVLRFFRVISGGKLQSSYFSVTAPDVAFAARLAPPTRGGLIRNHATQECQQQDQRERVPTMMSPIMAYAIGRQKHFARDRMSARLADRDDQSSATQRSHCAMTMLIGVRSDRGSCDRRTELRATRRSMLPTRRRSRLRASRHRQSIDAGSRSAACGARDHPVVHCPASTRCWGTWHDSSPHTGLGRRLRQRRQHPAGRGLAERLGRAGEEPFARALAGKGRARLDLAYGDGPRNRFDLFLPEGTPKGLVVYSPWRLLGALRQILLVASGEWRRRARLCGRHAVLHAVPADAHLGHHHGRSARRSPRPPA